MATRRPSERFLWLFLLLHGVSLVSAVLPTGEIALQLLSQKPRFAGLLCSPSAAAGWGVHLPETQNSRWKHIFQLPETNAEGCAEYVIPSVNTTQSRSLQSMQHNHNHGPSAVIRPELITTLVLADRGNCSFLDKALRAQAAGARGLVIRGTRKAVYESLHQNSTRNDTLLEAKPVFEYDCSRGEGFVTVLADPEWDTDTPACNQSDRCSSGMCIATGRVDEAQGGHQVCCLWDTHILMGMGNRTLASNLTFPVVYVTIADGKRLERSLQSYPDLLIRTFRRDPPVIDISSMLLWAIGVATAIGASYYSALPDRRKWIQRLQPSITPEHKQQHQQHTQQETEDEEIWELDTKHAVAFIVGAGVFLTLLYYIKVGRFIPVLFAISATGTLTQIAVAPLLNALVPAIASRQLSLPGCCLGGGSLPLAEVLGFLLSATLAVAWYLHRRTWWLVQDVFGVSLCFLFLRTVQVPNLKVATILLSMAFFYDIFFVFISPLFFGSSVMEDVATGGPSAATRSGYPGVDYCERYPEYEACLDPEPMPMLLVMPRILNWVGGASMLGLGDIIMPGMLLSFALRFDYSPRSLGENYYRSMCIGYMLGLGLANVAVMLMQIGQPALMYLVPTTLGFLLVLSWQNGDLRALWIGLDDDDKKFEPEADELDVGGSDSGAGSARGNSDALEAGRRQGSGGGHADGSGVHDHVPLLSSPS